ncbi:TspO/MBR related protein [Sinobaca qinghaiensis]|uniref:TspO/MBR related protein n=1 Tax=Sinobaca qinghaiensis TaxID=342944 RepID=A0A419V8L1_9BACL|nr:tryptophan-rich sensory protein [Sinobaca qinghaiensis]RKD76456.1 TspO/MBR related protein [Sinobaca qinghaiensis]
MNYGILILTFFTVVIVAVLGNLLIGKQELSWFEQLKRPKFFNASIKLFLIVGILYYMIVGIILYRALDATNTFVVVLSIVILVLNELWNIAFFKPKSTFNGFMGIVIYLVPCIILFTALLRFDNLSAFLFFLYVLWVLYDLYWTYGLWKLNKSRKK